MTRRHTLKTIASGLTWVGAVAVFGTSLAGCSADKPKFHGIDITGADYAKDFQLTDFDGQPRALADFRGKAVVVFFGFTQCPDVCQTTLNEMARVKQLLGADAGKLQVLFISVDPERDTPEVLKAYRGSFDPTFLGLYAGSPEQLALWQKTVHMNQVDAAVAGLFLVFVAVIVLGCARDWYQLLTRRKPVELRECPYVPLAEGA